MQIPNVLTTAILTTVTTLTQFQSFIRINKYNSQYSIPLYKNQNSQQPCMPKMPKIDNT